MIIEGFGIKYYIDTLIIQQLVLLNSYDLL